MENEHCEAVGSVKRRTDRSRHTMKYIYRNEKKKKKYEKCLSKLGKIDSVPAWRRFFVILHWYFTYIS